MFIILLAIFPDGSFKTIFAIFFRPSKTLPPFASIGHIKSLIDIVTLALSILLEVETVEEIRSSCCN
jgi:hypothetical protein